MRLSDQVELKGARTNDLEEQFLSKAGLLLLLVMPSRSPSLD